MALACSFCGTSAGEGRSLVATAAETSAICEACTHLALDLFAAADLDASRIDLTAAGREAAERLAAEGCR